MAGGYVYDDLPEVVIDTTQETKEAEVSPTSPCGKPLAKPEPLTTEGN
jgi:hypothetical protein